VGVGLTTAYSGKLVCLFLPRAGTCRSPCSVQSAGGRLFSGPGCALGVGAALGGALLGRGEAPVILQACDKVIPLAFIAAGAGLSVAVAGLRLRYFSSLWNLTPAVQRAASGAACGAGAARIDSGRGRIAGGRGAAAWAAAAAPAGRAWLGAT